MTKEQTTPLTISGIPVLDSNGSPIMVTDVTQTRLVIIHDTDADGICAAWCINKGFKDEYDSVLLIPQRAGVNTIPVGLLPTDSVYMVDRTYPWDILIQLSQQVFNVTVIDHHKLAMDNYVKEVEELTEFTDTMIRTRSSIQFDYSNITVLIDTNHSACMLAHLWSMEHSIDPDTSVGPPWFVSYIEDRDIWKWELPNSKAINSGLHYLGHTFEQYDQYILCIATHPLNYHVIQIDGIHNIGTIVLQTQFNIIKSIAHGPTVTYLSHLHNLTDRYGRLTGNGILKYAVLCCPFTLISDMGDYFLNYHDRNSLSDASTDKEVQEYNSFAEVDVVLCYNETTDGYVYSIRSKQDMLWLAQLYGGGGHPSACGFTTKIPPSDILNWHIKQFETEPVTNVINPSLTGNLISKGF